MDNKLIEQLKNISLNKSKFYVECTRVQHDKKFFITKIRLNFYQLWSIFGQIPIIHTKGKCKYEWIIRQENSNRIFSIFDWNNKNKLMDTTQWYIRSNMPDDCSDFLETLADAIECYNLYYKHQIENETETSFPLDPDVYEIKNNLKKYICLLKTL
jgi:hypothetical protein